MTERLKRTLQGGLLLAGGFAGRNRRAYGPAPGVRVLMLHAEDMDDFDRFRQFVDWCGAQYPFVGPEALTMDAAAAGGRDTVLLTIDDGHARTFPALEWLAGIGVRVLYFVIPSYIGRSVREFLALHASRGVEAYNIAGRPDLDATRGLDLHQLRQFEAMGHRLGAHNNAHRDLRTLDAAGARYEIADAADSLAQMLGHGIDDFAWAFGKLSNITPEALTLMRAHFLRVYSSVRGLNVPHVTSAVILRDPVSVDAPTVFNTACIRGALDHSYRLEREELVRMTGRLGASS